MSKFFAGGQDDSDLGSSSEEELLTSSDVSDDMSDSEDMSSSGSDSDSDNGSQSGNENDDSDDDGAARPRAQYMRNQFLKGQGSDSSEEDSSDEDDRKTVKSSKDKLLDEIESAIKATEQSRKENDWLSAVDAFERLSKALERSERQYQIVPASAVKLFVDLEVAVPAEAKTARKTLPPSQSKALNVLNQRLKRVAKEYQRRLEQYKEDPEAYAPSSLTKTKDQASGASAGAGAKAGSGSGSAVGIESLSSETVFRTLAVVVEGRGKKNTDRQEQVSLLEQQLEKCATTYQKLMVLLMLIPVRFDSTAAGSVMPAEIWKAIFDDLSRLFALLEEDSEFIVVEDAPEIEIVEKGPAKTGEHKLIPGSLSALVARLDDELLRALQMIDPHTTGYIDRLRDENMLYGLMLRTQTIVERSLASLGRAANESDSLCLLLVRRLDHIYYKPTLAILAAEREAWQQVSAKLDSKITPRPAQFEQMSQDDSIALVSAIGSVLFRQSNTALRSRAVLMHVYHYALCNQYNNARDLMLMSHLQSTIHSAEPTLQIMFNRTLVQVGLCAFRVGLISESMTLLQEICSSSRIKELLGQGVAKFATNASPDRSQILPFHMHINLELIECVYLTASLLVEIPHMAGLRNTADVKKKAVSKPFRRMLDHHDRQVFNGPSENTRDHIILAAKSLQQGDWRTAISLLKSIRIWSLLANTEEILEMLANKLQVEALRTWLFTYGYAYSAQSLDSLAEQFELPKQQVKAQITKMIASDEISAGLDESSDYVQFSKDAELNRLETLALALADKAAVIAERNERLASDGHGLEQKPVRKTGKRDVKVSAK